MSALSEGRHASGGCREDGRECTAAVASDRNRANRASKREAACNTGTSQDGQLACRDLESLEPETFENRLLPADDWKALETVRRRTEYCKCQSCHRAAIH